jgi:hypothetical protein
MPEIWIAAGIVAILVLTMAAAQLFHGVLLLSFGAAAAGAGLAAGVVAGTCYHVALYRVLEPVGLLRPGWWWRPTAYNELLPPEGRRGVMSWFYAGVACLAVSLAGCALMLAGIFSL